MNDTLSSTMSMEDYQISAPNLPGFRKNPQRAASKKQAFSMVNGLLIETGSQPANPKRSLGQSMSLSYLGSDAPDPAPCSKNQMPDLPGAKWVNNAGKVLQFDAFFKEGVNESAVEQERVRRVVVYYYLEDDTMQIVEHKQENACIPQGTFVKRHMFPSSTSADGYLTLDDVDIGRKFALYGRTFYVVDCDSSTRSFLEAQGREVPSPQEMPWDSHETKRKLHAQMETGADPTIKRNVLKSPMKKFMEASLGNTVNNAGLKSFLESDRKVLRFTAAFDDRASMFGDVRFYTIHYFVADGTLEVLEQHQANNGRDPFPYLLRRQKVPMKFAVDDPNGRADVASDSEFYSWQDLAIGTVMDIYNRTLRIISADASTRNFYETEGAPLQPDCEHEYAQPENPRPLNPVPMHSGFGSDSDSMSSCKTLIPKPPKTQFDIHGVNLPAKILRFSARMDTTRYDDVDRRFVILIYLADNTIQVREPPARNSGVVGGMWLSRQAVQKEDGTLFQPMDFYAGATMIFNHSKFIVLDVDEHTLIHMDRNAGEFPMADVGFCLAAMKEALSTAGKSAQDVYAELDVDGNNSLSVGEFAAGMRKIFAFSEAVPDQMIITAMRNFDADKSGTINLQEFIGNLA
jgi:hypothetical protein